MGPSGAAVFEAVLGREEYGSGEDGAVEWEKNMLEFADGNFNDAGMRYERRDVERQRARWHDPALRATPVAWAHAQAASTLPEGSPKATQGGPEKR